MTALLPGYGIGELIERRDTPLRVIGLVNGVGDCDKVDHVRLAISLGQRIKPGYFPRRVEPEFRTQRAVTKFIEQIGSQCCGQRERIEVIERIVIASRRIGEDLRQKPVLVKSAFAGEAES